MPEVQKVGVADYAQYQPSQYQGEVYTEDYNTQPEVYDEQMAEIQAANKSRLGAKILTGAIAVGLGIGGYYLGKRGKGDIEAVKKELEELKNSDAIKNYENIKKGLEEIENIADDNQGLFFGRNRIGRKFYTTLKNFIKPYKKAANETKEAAEDTVKKAVDEAKETTENA